VTVKCLCDGHIQFTIHFQSVGLIITYAVSSIQPGEIVEIDFDRMSNGPHGVGRLADGMVVLALGAAPNETARVEITRTHKRYLEGRVIEIVTPSPDRRAPPCTHAERGECGGCPWQHLTTPAQQREKEAVVRREVGRVAPQATVRPILSPADEFGYRRRARLGYRDGIIGYRYRGQRRIFELHQCPVLDPRLESSLDDVRKAVEGRKSGNVDILLNNLGEVVIGGDANVFHQPSAQAEACLIECVLEAVPETATSVCELFAGMGTFTVPLLARGHSVVAWEGSRQTIQQLKERAPTAQTMRSDLLRPGQVLDFGRPDALVLDPPRRGAAECIAAIVSAAPRYVCYVSCDPMTLCRDIRTLGDNGFSLQWVQPVDAFPQTHHVECVALLTREAI
jgi:tRNA/tmRNA/rRNA uracil-C5-methylase (TrmA/RlmC/RlmD family)